MKATYKDASHYKFQLTNDFKYNTGIKSRKDAFIHNFIYLYSDGLIVILTGYAWDGCTGVPDTRKNLRGGLVHDAFYQLSRAKLFPIKRRNAIDKLFKRILREDGFMFPRLFYFGVKHLAWWAAKPKKEKIYTAP